MTHGQARHRFAHARAAVLTVLLALGAWLVFAGSPAAAAPDAAIATVPHDTMPNDAVPHVTAMDVGMQHTAVHSADATAPAALAPAALHAAVVDDAHAAAPEALTCATCGAEQHEAMAACSLMLFAVALLALPFVTRRRWTLPLRREVSRSVGRLAWMPHTPDLTALRVLRT